MVHAWIMVCMIEKFEAPWSILHYSLHTGLLPQVMLSSPSPCQPWNGFLHNPNPNWSHSCFLLDQNNEGQTSHSMQWVHHTLLPYLCSNTTALLNPRLVQSDECTHNGSCCALDPPFSHGNSYWASQSWLGSHFPPEAFPDITISLHGLWALLCASIPSEHLRTHIYYTLAAQPRGKEEGPCTQTTKFQCWLLRLLIIWQETQPYCNMGSWSIMVKGMETQTMLPKFIFFP